MTRGSGRRYHSQRSIVPGHDEFVDMIVQFLLDGGPTEPSSMPSAVLASPSFTGFQSSRAHHAKRRPAVARRVTQIIAERWPPALSSDGRVDAPNFVTPGP